MSTDIFRAISTWRLSDSSYGVGPWYEAGGAPKPLVAYQADRAASLDDSKINLINPGTNDLILAPNSHYSEPDWDPVDGWVFPETKACGWDTGIIPSDGNYSMIIKFTNQYNQFFGYCGCNTPYLYYTLSGANVPGVMEGVMYMYGQESTPVFSPPPALDGVLGLTPSGGYRNGILDRSPLPTWAGTINLSICIGCRNTPGTATQPCLGNIQRFAVWQGDISPYIQELSAAIAE